MSRSVGRDGPSRRGRAAMGLDYVILEAWSQGFLVGGLVILIMITLANIRRGVLLHKLILLEVCMPSTACPSSFGAENFSLSSL